MSSITGTELIAGSIRARAAVHVKSLGERCAMVCARSEATIFLSEPGTRERDLDTGD